MAGWWFWWLVGGCGGWLVVIDFEGVGMIEKMVGRLVVKGGEFING